jgi:hypothetical protein
MRHAPVAMILIALCMSSMAYAGANPNFTLPLHAIAPATFTETCSTPQDPPTNLDCINVRPTVDVPCPGTGVIYLYVMNHNELKGVQTAFEWGGAGGWSVIFGNWDCQPGQLSLHTPVNPGGPDAGLLNTAFNCVLSTQLQVIGFMTMNLAPVGCINQVQPIGSAFQALDCDLALDEFTVPPDENAARLGMVCCVSGGVDACDPLIAVEPTTWGSIKSQYR